ncbi:MAG: flagellar biosynthesis anti-sigma factor FlgM [Rhodanobacteraceae bacterium]
MKIDNIQHLSTPKPVEQGRDAEKTGKATPTGEPGAGSVTHLSHAATDSSQDIDQARVAELRQAIADGRLKMDTSRIADRLIASARDLAGGAE